MRRLACAVLTMMLLALIPAPAMAAASAGRLPDEYVVPGDRAFPTGSAFDRRTGHFYVGSAETGTIYRGHVTRREMQVWSPDGTDGRTTTSGMAMDLRGRLYVGGADTGTLRVYDVRTQQLLAELHGTDGGFLNEIAVADDGTVYATDSFKPVIYRITHRDGDWRIEEWLDVSASVDWVDGKHNLNGITDVAGYLLTVNSATGSLWRIDPRTGETVQVDLDGHRLSNGDGLAWRGNRLYVVQGNLNQVPGLVPQVAVVRMSSDLARGRYIARHVPEGGFRHPSSIVLTRTRVMVVNSQYDRWLSGQPPVTPFTVSSMRFGSAEPVTA